jgi:hypothetical protein
MFATAGGGKMITGLAQSTSWAWEPQKSSADMQRVGLVTDEYFGMIPYVVALEP